MSDCANVIYQYDGTFEGLLCCVFESVYSRELPMNIVPLDEAEPSLIPQRYIVTDSEKALRVYNSIAPKMGETAAELVQTVFLSCARDKEIKILRFLLFGYKRGMQTMRLLSHPIVTPLLMAQQSLKGEVHLLLGFVRFSDYDGALVASITPKNYVLPFMKHHFCSRYACESFLIYDKTHRAALVYRDGAADIVALEHLETPPASEEEQEYRALWQRFYKTISIAARENPRCRMTHMPKRYWENMLEVRGELRRMPATVRAAELAERTGQHGIAELDRPGQPEAQQRSALRASRNDAGMEHANERLFPPPIEAPGETDPARALPPAARAAAVHTAPALLTLTA